MWAWAPGTSRLRGSFRIADVGELQAFDRSRQLKPAYETPPLPQPVDEAKVKAAHRLAELWAARDGLDLDSARRAASAALGVEIG